MKPGEWKLLPMTNGGTLKVGGRGIWIELGDELPAPGEMAEWVMLGASGGRVREEVSDIVLEREGSCYWVSDNGSECAASVVTRHIPPRTVTIPAEATDAMVEEGMRHFNGTLHNQKWSLRIAINAAIRAGVEEVSDE